MFCKYIYNYLMMYILQKCFSFRKEIFIFVYVSIILV